MSRFDEKWADYPIPIIMELIKSGRLKDIDPIASEVVENNNSQLQGQLPGPNQPKLLPMMTEKMFKSDMFSPDEQSLYVFLSNFQQLLEKNDGKVEGCIERTTEKEGVPVS
jgi:hypothetical protein